MRLYCWYNHVFVINRSKDLHHWVSLRFWSHASFAQIVVGADSTFISRSDDWSITTVAVNVWMLHSRVLQKCRFSTETARSSKLLICSEMFKNWALHGEQQRGHGEVNLPIWNCTGQLLQLCRIFWRFDDLKISKFKFDEYPLFHLPSQTFQVLPNLPVSAWPAFRFCGRPTALMMAFG